MRNVNISRIKYMTFLGLVLLSWSYRTSSVVAIVAERHLSEKAKSTITELLGGQSLSDIAYESRKTTKSPSSRKTVMHHILSLPPGLNYVQFQNAIASSMDTNVYSALLDAKHSLYAGTRKEKAEAVKLLLGIVADIHDPLQIGHTKDARNVKILNLNEKLIPSEIIKLYDNATARDSSSWQNDDYLKWLYESYLLNNQLYNGLKKGEPVTASYIKHLALIKQRIMMAGIRLAYLFNECFKGGLNPSIVSAPDAIEFPSVQLSDLSKHIGEKVSIKAKVYDVKIVNDLMFVSLGEKSPNQLITLILSKNACEREKELKNKVIRVNGRLMLADNKLQIAVSEKWNLQIEAH